MCGIAGYWGVAAPERATALLRDMSAALAHRGPDGDGLWAGRGVGLAQRRLAIIDLAGGGQPMASADGRYRIVCNGEIYNHRVLRDELAAAGYAFRTRSDTEVVPAAIDRWGPDEGLRRLRGMFAFALHDSRADTLLLARDRAGIKPLYVGRAGDLTLFGSEPKALLCEPRLERRADPVALGDFFTLGEPLAPHTAFAAIRELEPGTWRELGRAGERSGRWFTWQLAAAQPIGEAEAVDRLEAALTDSLRAHLESDVPVASFLSGGVDSSVLVALLARLGRTPQTFTAGFSAADYDEAPHARAVARATGAEHHELLIADGAGTPELLQAIAAQYDQPFGDSSCLPTWLLCREMARHAKVVLSGDGGDEVFGGYPRYATVRRLANLHRAALGAGLVDAAGRVLSPMRPGLGRQLRKAARFARLPRAELLCALHTYFDDGERRALLPAELAAAAERDGPTSARLVRFVPAALTDPAEQLMAAELTTLLHADYLRKVDVASSAHGLEVRTPYLDPEVFALAARLPVALKVRAGSLKHVLRLLARRLLPDGVVDRPKQGFGIPFDRWAGPRMRDFLADLLVGAGARNRDWLRPEPVRRLFDAYCAGGDPAALSRYQVYQRVFMLASFELWLRTWSPTRP